MNKQEFEEIQNAWDSIEKIEHLEQLNKSHELSFLADICPRTISFSCDCMGMSARQAIPLKHEMNSIVMAALISYKNALKEKMESLRLTATQETSENENKLIGSEE